MSKKEIVMVTGSKPILELPVMFLDILDNEMKKGSRLIVGDGLRFDRLVQHYLKNHDYQRVDVVYTTGYNTRKQPRINMGSWHTVNIPTLASLGSETFEDARNLHCLNTCNKMIACWDKQTNDIVRHCRVLAGLDKKALVLTDGYMIHNVKNDNEVDDLAALMKSS